MSPVITIVLALILLASLFFIIPYIRVRTQTWVLIAFVVVVAILFLLPKTALYNMKLPIIDNSMNGIIMNFLNDSVLFSGLITLDPTIHDKLLTFIEPIINACFILIGIAIIAIILSIVLFIVHLIQHRDKTFACVIGLLLTFVTAGAIIMSPVCTLVHINDTLNNTVTIKGKTLAESYPNYQKNYGGLLSLLNIIDLPQNVSKIFVDPANLISGGRLEDFDKEMYNIDKLLTKLDEAGITVIYTDPEYDFTNATKDSLNFTILGELIGECIKSKIYDGLPLVFTNQILGVFEQAIMEDTGKTELEQSLIMTQEEVNAQYLQLMDMLDFVLRHDMAAKCKDMNLVKLVELGLYITGKGAVGEALEIMNYPLVKKIADDADTVNFASIEVGGAIYACAKLYDVLNDWLASYRSTEEYKIVAKYLEMREIIELPETEESTENA